MSKRYVQLRCNMPDLDSDLSSDNLTVEDLISGKTEEELGNNVLNLESVLGSQADVINYQFLKISIRTIPGMKFSLNQNGLIVVGSSGYYEIDNSNNNFTLNGLFFDVKTIQNFLGDDSDRKNGYLLMEIEYEKKE